MRARSASVVAKPSGQLLVHDDAGAMLHHVERRAEDVPRRGRRDGTRDGHVGVRKRRRDAVLARHVVRRRQRGRGGGRRGTQVQSPPAT